jgi:nucleoside-diphosphate kinase|tara:strand:- start:196 stop:672 length:477 start_codon:yes stop_codon:yes gene_type:complete
MENKLMPLETTLVLIKPDAIQRNLSGKIISRIEDTGLKIIGLKMITIDKKLAEKHYQEHKEKPFFVNLVDFISSSPVLAIAINGPNSIQKIRTLMGQTNPEDSPPGTIRGDYGIDLERNLIHGSANHSDAKREIDLFFDKKEIHNFEKSIDNWTGLTN